MVKIMENPIKMDDLRGFPPIFGNTQLTIGNSKKKNNQPDQSLRTTGVSGGPTSITSRVRLESCRSPRPHVENQTLGATFVSLIFLGVSGGGLGGRVVDIHMYIYIYLEPN